jgi:hypothetical protein
MARSDPANVTAWRMGRREQLSRPDRPPWRASTRARWRDKAGGNRRPLDLRAKPAAVPVRQAGHMSFGAPTNGCPAAPSARPGSACS